MLAGLIGVTVWLELNKSIREQSDELVVDITKQTYEVLESHMATLQIHLDTMQMDLERTAMDLCQNSEMAANIESGQDVAIFSLIESYGKSKYLDYAMVYNFDGFLSAAYPAGDNVDIKWFEDYFKNDSLISATRKKIDQEDAYIENRFAAHNFEFLESMSLKENDVAGKGAIAIESAGIIIDDFGEPIGICIAGRFIDQNIKPLKLLYESTHTASFIYLDTIAISQAGFSTNDDINLQISHEARDMFYEAFDSINTSLDIAGAKYFITGIPIKDYSGISVGIVLAGIEESTVKYLQNKMIFRGEKTRRQVQLRLYSAAAASMILVVFIALYLANSIVRPIRNVVEMVKDISEGEGDLTVRLDETRKDETGELARWFNKFVGALKEQVEGMTKGADIIAASTSQISTTAAELAASATQTLTSVNQISTTTEQVKQTVQLSTEKADTMADAATEVDRIAEQGMKATEDAVSGMNRVKEDMEYIAESIIKLSEQTQNISEVVNVVNDLANESNLLAVNAEIEAAKAGEFGKGFSVVAQEVKSLSDQSRQATAKIQATLNEIQNATGQAVTATERGDKTVDDGVGLANISGQTIKALTDSVSQSSSSATQIAASSRQQLTGIDQLSQAMHSIKDAAGQNVEGARRLEDATKELKDAASHLKRLSNKFKL